MRDRVLKPKHARLDEQPGEGSSFKCEKMHDSRVGG